MKKCPVCGVMMGDNVARCSMCKYDFQKASQGNTKEATAEAQQILEQKEAENIARAEAKRSEDEKRILEAIENLQDKFDSEKLRLESEFSVIQKKKLDEKIALEQEVSVIRKDYDQVKSEHDRLKGEVATMEADSRKKIQAEREEMIRQAKAEQERILGEAQQQTEQLAIQVEKEYGDAMSKRDQLLGEAKELQELMNNADKIKADKEAEIKACEDKIKKLHDDFEKEKVRITDELKRVAADQEAVSLQLKTQAEKERDAAYVEKEKLIAQAQAEREQIIAELEARNKQAQAELDAMTEQAKGVMADAEAALNKRDQLKKEISDFEATANNQRKELEAASASKHKELEGIVAAKRKETEELEARKAEAEKLYKEYVAQHSNLENEIKALTPKLTEARKVIEDAKKAPVLAEAAAQEIVLSAEKQAVFLKEAALSESQKGEILKSIEEKDNKIKEIEMEKAELEKKLAALEKSIAELEKKIREGGVGGGADNGPKDYSVEVVEHNSASEVDTGKLEKVLEKRAKDGWKLVQIVDDDGGKLISSLGDSTESASLSVGAYSSKEDRLVLIFDRPVKR